MSCSKYDHKCSWAKVEHQFQSPILYKIGRLFHEMFELLEGHSGNIH